MEVKTCENHGNFVGFQGHLWNVYMECLYGMSIWNVYMECLYGMSIWNVNLYGMSL